MTNETMHVGITQPTFYRKEILNSALDIIQVLKNFEKIKLIRKEKEVCKREFKRVIKELNVLLERAKTELPTIRIKEKPVERIEKKEKVIEMEKPSVSPEMRKLETDLSKIQEKLARL